jgi:DNA-binding GntR family transcriptional regulator
VSIGWSADSLTGVERVRQLSAKDHIARELKTAILTGRLEPGRTYSMGELAEQFGASRTPVREAVLELESRGLVEINRGVGFRVAAPTARDLREVLEIREMLEIPAMRRVAEQGLSIEAAKIADAFVVRLDEAIGRKDLVEYLDLDRRFHVFLTEQSGNERLAQVVGELRDSQRVPGLRAMADAGELASRNREHRALLTAIERLQPDQAEAHIGEHLKLSRLSWTTEEVGQ